MTHPDPVTDDTWPYPIPPTGPQTQPSGDDMPTPLPPPTPRTGRSS